MKLVAIILLVVSGATRAEFKDGNRLLSDMNGTQGNQMNALGYVAGATDATLGVLHCTPANVTLGQVHDIVKQQLENVPAIRHFTADVIISSSLGRLWPCDKKKGNTL